MSSCTCQPCAEGRSCCRTWPRGPVLVALAGLALALLAGRGAARQGAAGGIAPFDGRTLDGWDGDASLWTAGQEVIVGRNDASSRAARATCLVWQAGLVGDFELTFAFRVGTGRAACVFRGAETGRWSVEGLRVELPGGGWRRFRLRAHGAKLEAFADGEPLEVVPDGGATEEDEDPPSAGVLAFWIDGRGPSRLSLRDLRLRHLGPPPDEDAWSGRRAERPRWLAAGGAAGDERTVHFTTRFFPIAGALRTLARVEARGPLEVRLDGRLLGRRPGGSGPWEVDLAPGLTPGRHELDLASSAPVRAELEAWGSEGLLWRRTSDASWRAHRGDPSDWFFPHVRDAAGGETPGARAPSRPRDGPAVSGAPAETPRLPPGFELEAVPIAAGGRPPAWTALVFDGAGRLILGDRSGRLHLLDPAAAAPLAAADLGADLGPGPVLDLAWVSGALFAAVARGPSERTVWRLEDPGGDGAFDLREELAVLGGASVLLAGADGGSLWLAGTGRRPDLTGSRLPFPGRSESPGGWIVRAGPGGERCELFCAGLGDPRGLAFDGRGELLVLDRGAGGRRPTRLLHALSGRDFARGRADGLPAVLELGGSSAGPLASAETSAFPPPWRDALFVADRANRRLDAVLLAPLGATLAGRREPFLSGGSLAIDELAFGPRGALWFTAQRGQGPAALYRVRWSGPATPAPRPRRPLSETVRLRRELEALHGSWRRSPTEFVRRALAHRDPAVRHAARIALAFARKGG